MRTPISLWVLVLAALVAASLAGGCKDDADAPKMRVLQGRIVSIDAQTGVLAGSFYIERTNEYLKLDGKLAPNAEILINGVTATLQDLRVDDTVKVTGWEEKHGNDRKWVAKTVEVSRPTTTQPASNPEGSGT